MVFSIQRILLIAALVALTIACALYGGLNDNLDVALIRDGIALRAVSPFAIAAGLFLNYAGGVAATLGLALGGTILLWHRAQMRRAIWFSAIVIGGRLIIEAIKLIVHRARPALDLHPVMTHSLSFPSGHAANSMIAFTAVALFFAPTPQRARALTVAVIASLLIGVSRPLLGLHWPSDVVAGWSIGATWLLLWWPLAQRFAPDETQHNIVGRHRPALFKE